MPEREVTSRNKMAVPIGSEDGGLHGVGVARSADGSGVTRGGLRRAYMLGDSEACRPRQPAGDGVNCVHVSMTTS